MKKGSFPFLQTVSILFSIAILINVLLFIYLITPVSHKEQWQEIEIPRGSSFTQGISKLEEAGIVDNTLALLLLGRITNSDRQLKAGFYSLSPSMSPVEIFDALTEGRTVHYRVTLPEGSTLKDIRRIFDNTGLIDEEPWQLVYDKGFLNSLDVEASSLEGYVYPDTYNFTKGTDPETIFKIMVRRMREVFNEKLMERAEDLGMNEHEVLTLASIIAKEATRESEKPLISAVYHNRLENNMKLQADPTVLYGVENQRGRIRYRDLRRQTPYNTYVVKGLPLGPVASPGINSIKAALYPADVDYLFFVSKNDGTHYFSKTSKEHAKAVARYQLNKNVELKD